MTLNADIPDVSNTLSRLLLKLPELIKQAESLSRERGNHLLAKMREEAAKQSVNLTTDAISPALLFARPQRSRLAISTLPCSAGRLAIQHRERLQKR